MKEETKQAEELCSKIDLDVLDHTSNSITCSNQTSKEIVKIR